MQREKTPLVAEDGKNISQEETADIQRGSPRIWLDKDLRAVTDVIARSPLNVQ
jgi:hypothetical protein